MLFPHGILLQVGGATGGSIYRFLEGKVTYPYWSPYDFIIYPILLASIFYIVYKLRRYKLNKGKTQYQYFHYFIASKIFFSFALALIYVYYYKFGDTFTYWGNANILGFKMYSNIDMFKYVMKSDGKELNKTILYFIRSLYMLVPENLLMAKMTAFIMPLINYSYFSGTLLFAFVTSFGNWKLYRAFTELYPYKWLEKPLFFTCLMSPSCILWGSGILKDSVTFSALGWLFWSLVMILVFNKYRISYIVQLFLSALFLFFLKKYILLSFIPAFCFLVAYRKASYFKNPYIKYTFYSIILLALGGGMTYFMLNSKELLGDFAIDKIVETATTLNYNLQNTESGSKFSLGIDASPTPAGLLSLFPFAVNATLFRPYPWEARNIVGLASAMESLFFLLFTLYIIRKISLKTFFKSIFGNGDIQCFMIFSLLFSFAVGIATSNFGTLVRYKIPVLPFYLSGVLIIYYQEVVSKTKKNNS